MADPKWDDTEPTWDDTAEVSAPQAPPIDKQYSAREAAGLSFQGTPVGLGQGLSLGFGDEIGAFSGALGALSSGDSSNFWDNYAEIRDQLRAEAAAATEQQPEAAFAGELLGGFAVPIGAAGSVGKAGMTAANVGKARKIVEGGKAAMTEARVLREVGRVGQLAKTGAQAGAAAALGTSKNDLTTGEVENYKNTGEEMLAGAVLGAGVGISLQGLITGARLAGKAVQALPYADSALRVRELAKQGHVMAGEAKNISQEARNAAYKILSDLDTLRAFTGSLVGDARQTADAVVGNVKIDGAVQRIRQQIAELKPVGAAEKADINALKEVLSDILGETEKVHYTYIPKAKLPKASNAEKVEQKLAKKTAEAETKDAIKKSELEDMLASTYDEDEAANIIAKLKRLSGETQYPPTEALDDLTGLPVQGVSRGANKAPLVEAIMPEADDVFTPIQRVQVGTEIVPGTTTATPGELSSHLQSIRDVPVETSKGQRALGIAKDEVRAAQDEAALLAGEKGTEALTDLAGASKTFGTIKDLQKSLGLPDSGNTLNPAQKKNIIDNLQRAILGLAENKISSDRFLELTTDLAKEFPAAAASIKNTAATISDKYRLSKIMSSQSLEGVSRLGLAIPAMMTRAAEYGTRAEMALRGAAKGASKELVSLGKNIYEANPGQMQQLSEAAMRKGGTFGKRTAAVLDQLANAPQAKRKAVLFTLMQQPDFRELAKLVFDSEE